MSGRHRRGAHRGVPTGRVAVSVAAVGLGALQLGGIASAAPAAGGGGGIDGTSCTDARIKACVDLSENRAWLLDGQGNVVGGPVVNSHGSEGHETPTGDFIIQRKERHHVSREYEGAPMPYAVFFDNNGRAFHGGNTDAPVGRLRAPRHGGREAVLRAPEPERPGPDRRVSPSGPPVRRGGRDATGRGAPEGGAPRARGHRSSGAAAQHQRHGAADHDDRDHDEDPRGHTAAAGVGAGRRRR